MTVASVHESKRVRKYLFFTCLTNVWPITHTPNEVNYCVIFEHKNSIENDQLYILLTKLDS